VAATEVADVRFLRRKKRGDEPVKAKAAVMQSAGTIHADMRLEDLKARVRALENVKTVVTVRTRSNSSS
jgi:hypothetical protein